MDGEELTEQETALYDRQIRVWGANAQRRFYFLISLFFSTLILVRTYTGLALICFNSFFSELV